MPNRDYSILRLPKKSGGMRLIYAPSPAYKTRLQGYLPELNRLVQMLSPKDVVHGFYPGRSPVTNARAHIGYRFSVCFDLADFFDSVSANHVLRYIPHLIEDVIIDGAARQGLPTSPAVANLAAIRMDRAILEAYGERVQYTRYADDLSLSLNDGSLVDELLVWIPRIVASHGFAINPKKTHTQTAQHGRRIITGVAVGETAIYPPRRTKRKLRAAEHRGKPSRAAGLREWVSLKLPKEKS